MNPGSFGIIILAGGRGSRLGGQDKPGLVVGDDMLIASVARAGTGAGAAQIVVVGPERPGLDGVSVVREEPPGAGPVAALRRGLAEASAPWVAVLAADLPFLRASHLEALRAAAEGGPGAILVDDTGRPQWLAGWLLANRNSPPCRGRLPPGLAARAAGSPRTRPGQADAAARGAAAVAGLRYPRGPAPGP